MDEDEIIAQNSDGFQCKEHEKQALEWEKRNILKLTDARLDYRKHVREQKTRSLKALDTLARKLGRERDLNHNARYLASKMEDK